MSLRLYLVSTVHSKTNYLGYDTYDSFVCCCHNEEDARRMHPSMCPETTKFDDEKLCWVPDKGMVIGKYVDGEKHLHTGGWIYGKDIDTLTVELLGTAKKGSKKTIVCASYNAG